MAKRERRPTKYVSTRTNEQRRQYEGKENEGNSNDDDKKVADSNVRIEDNEDIAAPFTKCQKLVQADLWFLNKSCMVRNFPSLRKEESSKTLKIEYYTSKKWV